MQDSEDFDFEESNQRNKKKPSRRRKDENTNEDTLDSMLESTAGLQKDEDKRISQKKPVQDQTRPNKAINSWGEDTFSPTVPTVKSHRRELGTGFTADFNNVVDEIKPKVQQREMNNDNDDEIPAIPDLEEANEVDDMAFQVADAPEVQVHQLSTYKELDKEFFKEKAFQFLEGNIDVSMLHCGLNTEDQIAEEEDIIWEWQKLFTEIVSVLTVEDSASLNETNAPNLVKESSFTFKK